MAVQFEVTSENPTVEVCEFFLKRMTPEQVNLISRWKGRVYVVAVLKRGHPILLQAGLPKDFPLKMNERVITAEIDHF